MKFSRFIKKIIKKIFKPFLFLLILAGLVFLVGYSGFFNIADIEVIGDGKYVRKDDVQNILDTYLGKNILRVSSKSIRRNIQSNFLALEDVKIRKILPNKVKIYIKERRGAAILIEEGAYEGFLIASNGFILGFAPLDLGLPLINENNLEDIYVGTLLEDKRILSVLEIIEKLGREKIVVAQSNIDHNYYELYVSDTKIVLSAEKGIEDQVDLLIKILRKYQIEGKKLIMVDLRFKDPIVKYDGSL